MIYQNRVPGSGTPKHLLFAMTAVFMMPALTPAQAVDGPCEGWKESGDKPYCGAFLEWLPQFAEDFDIRNTEGRYAVDCSAPGGIELSGTGPGETFGLIVDGARVPDVEMWVSYYGNQSNPITFVYGLWPESFSYGLVVNGDQGGFYILEDKEDGHRLSQCLG